jgi:hypothetical protein
MKEYTYNAEQVLERVEQLIDEGVTRHMQAVYRQLNIFDWWVDKLSISRLKDMRKFLKEAIKLGYTGYVCFKVGATGCANGMWAYVNESEDGYSPDGDCLYKSFTPAYNYWQVKSGEEWLPAGDEFNSLKTIKDLEMYIEDLKRW